MRPTTGWPEATFPVEPSKPRTDNMWSGIKRRAGKAWLDLRCRGVYQSAPVVCDPASPVVVVSQLYHPDMTMYLLAATSFAQYVRPQRFVLVDDGLTPDDRTVLQRQLGTVDFVDRRRVKVDGMPEAGCWERFLTLAHWNAQNYVVQLDSDTLTLARPTEVMDCIQARRTFTLGTSSGTHVVPVSEATRYAKTDPDAHVQSMAECAMDQLIEGAHEPLYVRGCAGFTGFSPGYLDVERIRAFSQRMEGLLGAAKWRQWGSEQVTSNFFAANAPQTMVLPVDRYPFWQPGLDIESAAFVHFFGTFRFSEGMYARKGASIAGSLRSVSLPLRGRPSP